MPPPPPGLGPNQNSKVVLDATQKLVEIQNQAFSEQWYNKLWFKIFILMFVAALAIILTKKFL